MSYNDIPKELRKFDPVEFINRRCYYDPISGKAFYKKQDFGPNPSPRNKQWNTLYANREAGFKSGHGYLRVSFGDKPWYYVHQIAFACMVGYIPIEVDHEDKVKANNKWDNLRDANRSKNSTNAFKRIINKSGFKGVSWSKSNKCWRMDIAKNHVKYYDYYKTIEEAYEAYCKKSAELHKEFGCVE